MVLTPKFCKEFKKLRAVRRTYPQIERRPRGWIFSGGRYLTLLNERWVEQWGLGNGDQVIAFIDTDEIEGVKTLIVSPFHPKIQKVLEAEGTNYVAKRLVQIGSSFYLPMPAEWIEELDLAKSDTFVMFSNGLLAAAKDRAILREELDAGLHQIILKTRPEGK
jgi:hypothetical protein